MVYKIIDSHFKKNFNGKNGEMSVWNLTLDTGDRAVDCEMIQKPTSAVPEAGGEIAGTIESGKYGPIFRKDFGKTGEVSSLPIPAKNPKDSWRKHPAEVAGARRAHAQHMALMELAIVSRRADFDFRALDDDTFIKTKIDWWDQDARDASEKAEREDD